MTRNRDILLIDAEHGTVHPLARWQAEMYSMGMSVSTTGWHDERSNPWRVEYPVALKWAIRAEEVRRSWYRKNGLSHQYVPKKFTGRVVLNFSYWEQAEARHKDDKATKMDPLKGRRFVGISEPTEYDMIDNDFLKRFTGDEWVETKTLNVKSKDWKPQGTVIVASGQKLKMPNA